MIFLKLAFKSIRNRLFITSLTVTSIALSVFLLLSVEKTRRLARDGFTNAISQTDLVVGARTGPLNLVLYSIFNMGSASNNVSWKTYQEIKNDPAVDWVIPYSLGDSHRGFRVVATDENFYKYYRFRSDQQVEFLEGKAAQTTWDVVIGSQVQKKLKYSLSDEIIVTHGVTKGEGVVKHDDKPFRVVGILKPTGTAIDQTVYITLQGMVAMHETEESHAHHDHDHDHEIHNGDISAFFLRAKARTQTLSLQRKINEYTQEPLTAVIPGMALAELWNGLSQVETVLQIISIMTLGIGLVAMLGTLLASLNERRREMSILRSLGAGPSHVALLLVFESFILTLLGVLLGVVLQLSLFYFLAGWLEKAFGFYFFGSSLALSEVGYLIIILLAGAMVGLVPAVKSSRAALKDGLTAKI